MLRIARLVEMSRKSSELKQLVLLQSLSEADIVEVIEAVYRVTKSLVVLLLDEQGVVRLVDGLDVQLQTMKSIPAHSEETKNEEDIHAERQ